MPPSHPLHHVETGRHDGPVIVFLHGITGSRRYWEKRVGPLARRYRLVLPDLIGFGLSPKPEIAYSMTAFRDSLREFLVDRGLADRPIHFVAHSLGSLIALEYAAAYGDHVRRMVLFSLPRFRDSKTAHELFWRGSPHYRRLLKQQSLRATLAQMRRSGLEVTLRYLWKFPWSVIVDSHKCTLNSLTSTLDLCLLNYQVDDVLPRVPQRPCLLLHGERDAVAPLAHVRDLPELYPAMRLEVFRGTGHHLFLTHPEECLALLTRFLDAGEPETVASTAHSLSLNT
ncbi:MAG TPA: alpha/beta hydrolase [Candidatus Polarisedimenticolia bacterium]|nr:alpha/beta hydrolase [Candidatus Polarisedimenticolia bacterium]